MKRNDRFTQKLIDAVEEPKPLGSNARARIRAALSGRNESGVRRRGPVLTYGTSAALVLISAAVATAATSTLMVPVRSSSAELMPTGRRVASVVLGSTLEPVRLREGELTIEALHGPVLVQAPDGLVHISDLGIALVEVENSRLQHVEAIAGATEVSSKASGPVRLDEGMQWRPGELIMPKAPALYRAPPAKKAEPAPDAGSGLMVIETEDAGPSAEDEALILAKVKKHIEAKDWEAALDRLDDYATTYSHDGKLRFEALELDIVVLGALKQPSAALAHVEAAKLKASEHPALVTSRGELRALAGRHKEAIADFDAVLALDKLAPVIHERALYGRGQALLHSGRVADARGAFQTYCAKYPRGQFYEVARRHATEYGPVPPNVKDPIPSAD